MTRGPRALAGALLLVEALATACGSPPAAVEAVVENGDTVEIVVDLLVRFDDARGDAQVQTLMDGVVVAAGGQAPAAFDAPRGEKLLFESSVVRAGTTWEMPGIETPARRGTFVFHWAPLVGGGYGYETADWAE